MSDKLWEIAAALHTVIPIDRKSLDTLTGCITLLISMASQQEKLEVNSGKSKESE